MADVTLYHLRINPITGNAYMADQGSSPAMPQYVLATDYEALRKRCEAVEAMRFAGTLLSNIAFNLAQDDSLPETTRWSLDDARKRWDAVIAAAQEPSHG